MGRRQIGCRRIQMIIDDIVRQELSWRQREKPKTEDTGCGQHQVDCPGHKPASQQITREEEEEVNYNYYY